MHGEYGNNRGKLDIWMLGITIVIGGQYFSWNAGLATGFVSYFIAYLLVAAAYLTLCCCTAEITGALPFAGGAYGLSRCTLGFFPGFIIGCCEALEYIAYVATTTLVLADMIVSSVPSLEGYEPLIWALFYITALWFHIRGGQVFWRFNLFIGAVSLLIVVIYSLGSLSFVNFSAYTAHDPSLYFVGGFTNFMKMFPLAGWFFVGVEALSLASDDVPHPKTTVPIAQVACVITLTVSGVMVYFITASLDNAGGIAGLASQLVPLDYGFELMFKITTSTATWLSFPATYATAFGFIWCYGKLIHAMSTSRLLPAVLSTTSDRFETPYIALLAGSTVSYAICVLVYCVPVINKYLFSICITSAFAAYTGQCIGYISLKMNYRNIKSSHFQSPFGICGAIFSMTVWIFGIVCVAGYQGNGSIEILSFLIIVGVLTIFYHAYAKKRQTFSAKENKVLLVAHVMKFNAARFNGKHKTKVVGSRTTKNQSSVGNAKSHATSKASNVSLVET
ncbi:hypothetical protein Poli38472_011768 [Pythium oligandrum]|uniref:Amino acid permease/ SLC12A domain-containing protein n=1 Tax=Pythium oligandrum TaxID=41045 RepID=A0A8K1C826_PYTOL|nr:hypothetical protein Poli38472_011768 [Pythium oligandrum]|eukprot:TMW58180.1 hypothetical protein Poli38472_011768 [Pythium oligandrum]